jgi:serine phosphatase RsbU (regulator of sigma subunit)
MKKRPLVIFSFLFLLMTCVLTVSAQNNAAAEVKQLTKEMYEQFNADDYEKLTVTVGKLKDACVRAGDYKTFYKAWGNLILKTKTHVGRPQAMKMIKEMRDYAVEHDHKFGLYSATYTTAYLLNQIGDQAGAQRNYLKAAEYLKKYYPEESVASIYVSLSKLALSAKEDTTAIHYARQAINDPHVTPLQRHMAKVCMCLAYGWLGKKKEFEEAYAKLKAINDVSTNQQDMLSIEIFRAKLQGDFEKAKQLAHQYKSKQMRVLYIYKTLEWAGDWKEALEAFKDYRFFLDSVNNRDVREQAALYHSELNVALAENESKDLRLANKRLQLIQMEHELEHQRLEVEAANLKLKNSDIELANAAIKSENDSLERSEQAAKINEYKSRMEAEEKAEHAHHVIIAAAASIAVLILGFLLFYLHRRQRQMHRLQQVNTELKTAYEQLKTTKLAKERMENELQVAREIQLSMLPHNFVHLRRADAHAFMRPAKFVGGDLYDFFYQNDKLYFCIGDVAGKGVPASMLMAVAVNLFRMTAKEGFSPQEIATKLNDAISTDNEQGMFVTMFIAIIDLNTGHMDFCNAGHNPPLLDGEYMDVESNAPIGLWPELEYIGQEVENMKGRTLFLYTDGLNEAENSKHQQFGDDRLKLEIRQHQDEDAHSMTDDVERAVESFVGEAEQSDDLTMLCIKMH